MNRANRLSAVTRRSLLLSFSLTMLGLVGAFAMVSCVQAEAELQGTKPGHVRLVWADNPSTTAIVSWNTAEPGKKHVVHYQAADGEEKGTADSYLDGPFTGKETLYYHHVKLTGLKPGTKYTVRIESDDQTSPEYYFLTAHDDERPFRLITGGDSRSGHKERRQMNRMLAEMLTKQPDILALVHGGDYIATGTNLGQWIQWMADHELTTTEDGRLLPIIPARGNHDRGKPFNEVFGFPADDTNYYALSFGQQLRLVTLNTEISAGGDQARWLDEELAQSRPTYRWLVAQYHRPAYPAVKSPSSAKKYWVPLFEKHNVDLVYEADGHTIKRTVPIRDEKVDPTGVVYIGEGGLGVGQRTPKTDRWYLQSPGIASSGHHVQLLSFDGDKLLCETILLGGKVFDEHTLDARK